MNVANELRAVLERELGQLTALRQEIGLKAHLAKADARTELDRLERVWERLQEEAKRIHAGDGDDGLEAKVRGIFAQLRSGYENVKHQLVD